MKRTLTLIVLLLAQAGFAGTTSTVKRLVFEDMTEQELQETVIPFGVGVVNAGALHDLRIGDGVTPGGVQVLDIRALTAPPTDYHYPLNMNNHPINLSRTYSIGASSGIFFIRAHGENILTFVTDYEPLGETGSTWYDKTNDQLVVTMIVEDTNTLPVVLYSTDIINGPWVEVEYGMTVVDANTILLRVDVPPEDDGGYVRITAGINPRVNISLPVEAPEFRGGGGGLEGLNWDAITNAPIYFDHANTQVIFNVGGVTWTNKP